MTSEILQCVDCGEPFCTACDDDFSHCPDCGDALCGECHQDALERRMCRCLACWDDEDLSRVQYSNEDGKFKIFKHYTSPKTGRLRE